LPAFSVIGGQLIQPDDYLCRSDTGHSSGVAIVATHPKAIELACEVVEYDVAFAGTASHQ